MSSIKVHKVDNFPVTPVGNALYLRPATIADDIPRIGVSSTSGDKLFKTLSYDQIKQAVSDVEHAVPVSTIAARNALALEQDMFVKVLDASADPDVVSGMAVYFYSSNTNSYTNITQGGGGGEMSTEEW